MTVPNVIVMMMMMMIKVMLMMGRRRPLVILVVIILLRDHKFGGMHASRDDTINSGRQVMIITMATCSEAIMVFVPNRSPAFKTVLLFWCC